MNLTTKTETITFGEKKILGIFKRDIKFKVVADIPDTMLDKYAEISKINPNEADPVEQRKAFTAMKDVIVEMLSIANSRKKARKFTNSLGIKGVNKIFVFLNNYINEVDEEKKNE